MKKEMNIQDVLKDKPVFEIQSISASAVTPEEDDPDYPAPSIMFYTEEAEETYWDCSAHLGIWVGMKIQSSEKLRFAFFDRASVAVRSEDGSEKTYEATVVPTEILSCRKEPDTLSFNVLIVLEEAKEGLDDVLENWLKNATVQLTLHSACLMNKKAGTLFKIGAKFQMNDNQTSAETNQFEMEEIAVRPITELVADD